MPGENLTLESHKPLTKENHASNAQDTGKPTVISAAGISAVSDTYYVSLQRNPNDILDAINAFDEQICCAKEGSKRRRNHRLSVRVSGKQFVIVRRERIANPFARALFGVVNESSAGSVIAYTFSIRPAVRVLLSLWFGLMTVVLLTGISAIAISGFTGYRLELVILSVIFLGSALGLVSLCLIVSRKGEKEIERVLLGIVKHNS